MNVSRLLLASLLLIVPGCAMNTTKSTATAVSVPRAPNELTRPDLVFAVLRYVYRWQLDEKSFLPASEIGHVEIWVRPLAVKTDAGDHSRFAEMWLPEAGLLVELKQANHQVPERNLVTKDSFFKIRIVESQDSAPGQLSDWTILRFPAQQVYSHLFQTRQQDLFPDATLEARLKSALLDYLHEQGEHEVSSESQTFYVAPISEVCNELWVYWANQHVALRFSADGDLADPQLWQKQGFRIHEVNLGRNITLSRNEAPDCGRFISRAWAGRLLYNCIVLGHRFTLEL